MKKEFNWNKYREENIAVVCKTSKETRSFCEAVNARDDMRWSACNFYSEDDEWCFVCSTIIGDEFANPRVVYVVSMYELEIAKKCNYQIVKWSDFMRNKNKPKKFDGRRVIGIAGTIGDSVSIDYDRELEELIDRIENV